jgi:hypothetical protein
MTIDEAGFLSSEIAAWAERHRTDPACRGWFSLAERVNRLLQKAILALKVPDSDNQVWTATLLLLRGISSFQGTVVLAERGMTRRRRSGASWPGGKPRSPGRQHHRQYRA